MLIHPKHSGLLVLIQLGTCALAFCQSNQPMVGPDVIFEEEKGAVAVEAEHFFKQEKMEKRAWHRHSSIKQADVKPDGDPPHLEQASGQAYLEALPDTRRTHGDKLIQGENFSNEPGKMAIVHYQVWINNPGRYYVWVRTYSTGTEDNGIHVGLDGQWPESGRRLQWTAKKKWFWDSKQRTQKVHTGVPGKIFLDIKEKGLHTISFSMREDGFEFDKWLMTQDKEFKRPSGVGPESKIKAGKLPKPFPPLKMQPNRNPASQIQGTVRERQPDGDGKVSMTGEAKVWHSLSFTLNGPFAAENDESPNPFRDYLLLAQFQHSDGTQYKVQGYFAADGNASQSSAESGTHWRVRFVPDRIGKWSYKLRLLQGKNVAAGEQSEVAEWKKAVTGSFEVTRSDKSGRDLRGQGRLRYVGKRYLQFAGSQKYFLKAGADAPETLLGYQDFDGTVAMKKNVPLKTYRPHLRDWNDGDPSWNNGKGKGLVGAVNYLSSKGCNAFSFLTYNAGGDGDNVWPHVSRRDKLHFDVSKLDQWGIVFDHATTRGMYLHFKLQETENDDNNKKGTDRVPMALNGGDLGLERKLYLREMIARFGHNLALNWNLGEENTQSTPQQQEMARFIQTTDPYGSLIVIHSYPDQQDKVYKPLMGKGSVLRGASLQNSHIKDTHWQTKKWVEHSAKTGIPWVIAFDESGSAAHGQCPDLGYRGFDGKDADGKYIYTQHQVRRQTLWGNLMAGGAGVEYYFGYKFAENDLKCEDWRSRDQSWDYCRIALNFFHQNEIPFWKMKNENQLVGNTKNDNSAYCLAQTGEVYVVFVASDKNKVVLEHGTSDNRFESFWFNPRTGEKGPVKEEVLREPRIKLSPPTQSGDDWVYVLRKVK